MDEKLTTFGDVEIEKRIFHHLKNLILLEDVLIEKMHISSLVSSCEKNYKCFIGYKDDENEIKELCRMLPKASAYVKSMMEKLCGCSFLLMMMSC